MAFPNQQNGIFSNQGPSLTNQQLSALLNLLGQQTQANPTSTSFNPNYFSQLMNLANQLSGNSQQTSTPVSQQASGASNWVIVRAVDDPSVIEAQEVAMGVVNLFPSTDGEKIYTKTWNKDGLIEPNVFVLQKQKRKEAPEENQTIVDLEKRVKALELSVSKLKKQKSSKPVKPKSAAQESVETVEEEIHDG